MKIKTAIFVAVAAGLMTGAQGAERKVIEITNFDQIRKIDHDTANYPSNAYYKLMNDIDASSSRRTTYEPGNLWGGGVFDGQGFTIKGLYIITGERSSGFTGLFGGVYTDSSRVINLRVEIDSVGGSSDVGGIAGRNEGTISNCSVSGSVGGSGNVGGLVGMNRGNIIDSYSTGNVRSSGKAGGLVGMNGSGGVGEINKITNSYATGNVNGSGMTGGLVGDNYSGTITNSYATGKVTGSGSYSVTGGLVGQLSDGTITKSYATGDVSGTSAVGGLVGHINGNKTITNCYSTGDVSGTSQAVGGLVGRGSGTTITNSYATGNVSGNESVGGLVGQGNGATITKSYATGNVSGTQRFVGGLVGDGGTITNSYATGNVNGKEGVGGLAGGGGGTITNCYSVGKVTGGSGIGIPVGGLAGSATPSNVINSYWDTETSTLTTSSGGTGKTTAQMMTKSTFVDWNFDTVWTIKEGISYPYLKSLGDVNMSGTFTLRYRAAAGGYIALGDTVQTVEYGSHGTRVVAMPDDGYEFTMWSDGASNFVRTDSNVTSNKTVTATFCAAANIKSLTYRAGPGGTISGPADQKVCGASNGLPVTAVPSEGYKFVEWSDGKKDAARTDAGGTASAEFAASFVIKTYTLVYSAGQNGSLIGGDAVMTVNHGSDGGLVLALADDGYEFVKWSDDVTSNPRTDRNVSANIAVSAVFDTLRHNLSYYVNPENGVLAGSAAQRVTHGSSGSAVYVTGANGYTFFEWSDGSTDTIRIDRNVQGDISVIAYFKDAEGNVSVSSSDRVIPRVNQSDGAAVIAPAAVLTAEFIAAPNPVGALRATPVQFFRQGSRISSATLHIYDASGNVVCKVSIKDNATVNNGVKRVVGSWDLRDNKGRSVAEGTYLVRGTVKTKDGKKERVFMVVGVIKSKS
jgi:hypothetical protein